MQQHFIQLSFGVAAIRKLSVAAAPPQGPADAAVPVCRAPVLMQVLKQVLKQVLMHLLMQAGSTIDRSLASDALAMRRSGRTRGLPQQRCQALAEVADAAG